MRYLPFNARNEYRTHNKECMNCIDNFLGTFKTEHNFTVKQNRIATMTRLFV